MLVLSRKVGEEIIIGGGITVKIVDRKGDKIRVGIDAPPDVAVDRKEVADKKAAQQKQGGT